MATVWLPCDVLAEASVVTLGRQTYHDRGERSRFSAFKGSVDRVQKTHENTENRCLEM